MVLATISNATKAIIRVASYNADVDVILVCYSTFIH